jgi:hypothetical protein
LTRNLGAAAFAVAALGALSGCGKEYVTFDPEYCSNLLLVDAEWPGPDPEGTLTDAELAVYKELGRPDTMRFLFDRNGDIYQREPAMHELFAKGNDITLVEKAWIYSTRNLEVRFTGGAVERYPISEKLRILVKHGDPHEIKLLNEKREKWFYYDIGQFFTFEDETLVMTERAPRTGFRRH